MVVWMFSMSLHARALRRESSTVSGGARIVSSKLTEIKFECNIHEGWRLLRSFIDELVRSWPDMGEHLRLVLLRHRFV